MALQLIHDPKQRMRAIKRLEKILKDELPVLGQRRLGWRGGNETYTVYSHGDYRLFAVFRQAVDAKIPRNWTPMGIFDPSLRSQNIGIELNVPYEDDGRVAGTLARDSETGVEYLLHDGSLKGGRKGVNRENFLRWSDWAFSNLTEIWNGDRPGRMAVMLGAIEPGISETIETYAAQAVEFKDWVIARKGDVTPVLKDGKSPKLLSDEFAGRGKRKPTEGGDYTCNHGYIVKQLILDRKAVRTPEEDVYRTWKIDALTDVAGRYTEVYEAKPTLERYELYKAIGQLLVHEGAHNSDLFLVVPKGEIPADIKAAIERLDISVIRFTMAGKKVSFFPRFRKMRSPAQRTNGKATA